MKQMYNLYLVYFTNTKCILSGALSCDSHVGDAGLSSAHQSLSHHKFSAISILPPEKNGYKKVLILQSTVMTNTAVEDEDKVN